MKTEASLLQAIASAGTLREQIVLTQELDALRASRTASVQAERDLDLANAVVEQTLRPVRVHEMHTAATDWMDEVNTSPIDKTAATQSVLAEAALWFGRTAAEVKADHEEFAEQARGQARRTAGAYGEQAGEMEAAYLDYVAFLHRREAASGLDQIQQLVDPHDNPKTTELPTDTFDTFEEPVAPENAGVDEMQSSYNAPLLQEIMSNGGEGGGGVPSQHGGGGPSQPPGGGSGMQVGASLADVPTLAIGHVMTLDQFIATERAQKAASKAPEPRPFVEGAAAPAPGVAKTAAQMKTPALQIRHRSSSNGSGYDVDHVASASWVQTLSRHETPEEAMGAAVMKAHQHGIEHIYHPGGYVNVQPKSEKEATKRTVVARFEREAGDAGKCKNCTNGNHAGTNGSTGCSGGSCRCPYSICGKNKAKKEGASGLDQIQQVVDSHDNPKPTGLPEEVAFPLNEEDMQTTDGSDPKAARPSQHNSAAKTAGSEVEVSSLPKCDVCRHTKGKDIDAAYDARLPGMGNRWGNVCQDCFDEHGPGELGTGNGQRLKVRGFKVADMYGGGDSPHGVPGLPVATTADDIPHPASGSFDQGRADGARDAQDPEQRPTYSDNSSHAAPYVQGYSQGYSETAKPQGEKDIPASVASLVSTATLESKDFKKGYRYAARWSPRQRIVRRGSVEFESGLYAGMLANTAPNQIAWAKAHKKWGAKEPFFNQRIAQHFQFTAMRAEAGTSTDLETMDPGVEADPGGNTPLNGPGTPPPLAGGMDPAAPGGAAPYNGAAPYSSPVAPDPEWVDPSKMSPQAMAFRKNVQAALLAQKEN